MIKKASERRLCFMLRKYNIRGASCRAGVEVKILDKKILEKKLWRVVEQIHFMLF